MNIRSTLEDEVKSLQRDLYMARTTIVELMPEQIRQLIQNYQRFKSHDEAYRWEQNLIEKLVVAAEPKPPEEMGDHSGFTERAYCPLCRGSAQSIYGTEGFAFPEGLKRHLNGSYNSQRCPVFEEIRKHSIDHIKMKEERQESLRLEEKTATNTKRSKSPPPLKI